MRHSHCHSVPVCHFAAALTVRLSYPRLNVGFSPKTGLKCDQCESQEKAASIITAMIERQTSPRVPAGEGITLAI